ncbi:MAG: sialidase family protein [Chitinophagaceae bacterium]
MRICVFIFLAYICSGCGTPKTGNSGSIINPLEWNEKVNRSVAAIAFGVPAIDQTIVTYKRKGKANFNIHFSDPKVIVVAEKPYSWGYYQFPTIERLKDGSLHAEWSMHADAIESYGLNLVGSSISKDGAKSWIRGEADSSLITGFNLSNGDMIKVFDTKPINVSQLKMPEPIGKTNFKYRKTNFTFYRLRDMPEGRNGVYIKRLAKGDNKWRLEEAKLDDPQGVRYSSRDLVPVVWWGDIHTMKDKSLVAGVYPGYYLKDNQEVDKQMAVVFFRSTDDGHSWKVQGRIPFTPDVKVDSMYKDRIGYSEPAYEVLEDGTLLCVIRSADGDGVTNGVGNGPMYATHSTDMGKTWTTPEVIAGAGALPRLLQLQNGVTVLSSGRPGVQLRFTKTGMNDSWTDPFEMLPYESKSLQEQYLVSCGYTGLLATGRDRFLIIYSDFRFKNSSGEQRKAIKIREVIVDLQ